MQAGLLEPCANGDRLSQAATTEGIGAVRVVSVTFGQDAFTMHTKPGAGFEWLYTVDLNYVNIFESDIVYPEGLPD